jgi:hypothetical protein
VEPTNGDQIEVRIDIESIRRTIATHRDELHERYGVTWIGVFGSYVRDRQTASSDVDVLVTFKTPPSLLEFVALENYLSDLLGTEVDLVMRDALKPHLSRRILDEVVRL